MLFPSRDGNFEIEKSYRIRNVILVGEDSTASAFIAKNLSPGSERLFFHLMAINALVMKGQEIISRE